jgi:hypothetical protein
MTNPNPLTCDDTWLKYSQTKLAHIAQYVSIQAKADPRKTLVLKGLQETLYLIENTIRASEEAKAAALPNIVPFD